MTTCTTTQANEAMMRDIGKTNQTYGHLKHWLAGAAMESMPISIMAKGAMKNSEELFYKLEKRD